MKIIFKKTLEVDLLYWKIDIHHKPLILNGARQVGKTYLMKWLGQNHFVKVAYFNFDEKPDLKQFFETTKDVNIIINNLELVNKGIIDADTLIFLMKFKNACLL